MHTPDPHTLRLYFFGFPRLEEGGREIAVKSRKGLALLAYLAVTGRPQDRDVLAGLLWPDYEQARARANLRSVLHALNQTPIAPWLAGDAESISLLPGDNGQIDIEEFAQLREVDSTAGLIAAAELYTTAFLDTFTVADSEPFNQWAGAQRERYRREAMGLLDELTSYFLEQEQYDRSEEYARRQLAIDDLHEPAWRQLMQALALNGRRGQALAEYQTCRAILQSELGIDPSPETAVLAHSILAGVTAVSPAAAATLAATSASRDRAQQVLLDKVRQFWVNDVLEHSLHGLALIELGMQTRPEAVDYPWRLVIQQTESRRKPAGGQVAIGKLFDESSEALLLLGDPGAGKTTMLLELARTRLDRAADDVFESVPVVLNLSSWANHGGPLVEWLVVELNDKYLIPQRIGRRWVEMDDLLLLLDGLDEVPVEQQADCVAAINAYRQEHGLVPLAVCCRSSEYENVGRRLNLDVAVVLQPLSEEQIDDHLAAGGKPLAGARQALREDDALREMACSPLMLSVITLAYQGASASELPHTGTTAERRQAIFASYMTRMFARRGQSEIYSQTQTSGWLQWLAAGLQHHSESIFQIERLQFDWLGGEVRRLVYFLLSRTLASLFLFLMFFLSRIVEDIVSPEMFIPLDGWLIQLAAFLTMGVVAGLLMGLLDWTRHRLEKRRTEPRPGWRKALGITLYLLAIALIFFVTQDVLLYVMVRPFVPDQDTPALLLGTLGINQRRLLLAAVIIFGFRDLGRARRGDIHTVETLGWSWRYARIGALVGIAAGLLIPPLLALLTGEEVAALDLRIIVFDTLLGLVLGLVFGGLIRNVAETQPRPNHGIRLSLRYGLLAGLLATTVYVGLGLLFVSVVNALGGDPPLWAGETPIQGVFMFAVTALWFGWLDALYHLALRIILTLSGRMPWRYARLLDYAAGLLLLRKVGGGYQFIHPLLQDYMVSNHSSSVLPDR